MNSGFSHLSPDLIQATKKLNDGDVVAIPTETVYGLAARVDRPAGVAKIFQLKERPFFDPLIVHVSSLDQVNMVVRKTPSLAKKLMEHFWPGPLTIVLAKRADLNSMITSGLDTVGVRMPRHRLTLELIKETGPLAAPSANKFGKTSPSTATHVKSEFQNQVQVIDGGPCEVGIESTVIGISEDERNIFIYRHGAVTKEMLEEFAHVKNVESPVAPGHMKHHYMPAIPLIILKTRSELTINDYQLLTSHLRKKPNLGWLNLGNDPVLASRKFYAQMRDLAESGLYQALVLDMSDCKEIGLWAALMDRASKASTFLL